MSVSQFPSPKDLLDADSDVPPRVKELGDTILDAIRGYVSRNLGPINKRLKAAEARGESADALIADLEARVSKLEERK